MTTKSQSCSTDSRAAGLEAVGWTCARRHRGGTIENRLPRRALRQSGGTSGGSSPHLANAGTSPFAMTDGKVYAPTIGFDVSFLKAARPGKFVGKGRVVSLGKTIAFTEAALFDEAGELVARATFRSRAMSGEVARG